MSDEHTLDVVKIQVLSEQQFTVRAYTFAKRPGRVYFEMVGADGSVEFIHCDRRVALGILIEKVSEALKAVQP